MTTPKSTSIPMANGFTLPTVAGTPSRSSPSVPRTARLTHSANFPPAARSLAISPIDPTGNFLLAENQNTNSIAVFRIDAATGALSQVSLADRHSVSCVPYISAVDASAPLARGRAPSCEPAFFLTRQSALESRFVHHKEIFMPRPSLLEIRAARLHCIGGGRHRFRRRRDATGA